MYAGEIVEQGPVGAVFARPRHPYTVALLDCLPRVDRPAAARFLPAIEGTLPDPRAEVRACQFAPRCGLAEERCRREHPGWFEAAPGHGARCFFWERVPPPGAARAPGRPARLGPAPPRDAADARGGRLLHRYRHVRAVGGVSFTVVGRRDACGGRGERLGEDDHRALRGRPPPAHRGRDPDRRPAGPPPAGGAAADAPAAAPDRLPEPRPHPQPPAADPRGRGPAAQRCSVWPTGGAAGPRPRACWRRWASTGAPWTCSRASSRVASDSAWRSREPSRPGRSWSCATSRPRRSTCRCRRPF